MKKFLITLIVVTLSIPALTFALPSSVDRITDHIEPLIKSDYVKGLFFTASSTTGTSSFAGNMTVTGRTVIGTPTITPNIPLLIETNEPSNGYTSMALKNSTSTGRSQMTFSAGLQDYYAGFIGMSGANVTNYPNTMELGCGFSGCGINFWSDGFLQGRMGTTGNLGLGTTTDLSSKLTIQGITGGQTMLAVASTTGSPMLYLTGNGNLSLGTSTGIANLTVYDNNRAGMFPSIYLGGNPNGDTDFSLVRDNDNDTTDDDFFRIVKNMGSTTASSSLVAVSSNGSFSIGTTSTTSRFNVFAATGTRAVSVTNASGTDLFGLSPTGLAMFGTSTPMSENGVNSMVTFQGNTGQDEYVTFVNPAPGKSMAMRVRANSGFNHIDIVSPSSAWLLGTYGDTTFGIRDDSTFVSVISIAQGNTTNALAISSTGNATFSKQLTVTGTSTLATTSIARLNLPKLTASRALFTDASQIATTTAASAALLNSLSDETGTGVAVFGTSPTITTPTFTTRATTAELAGGSAVSSSLTLKSTTGAGTTDFITFVTGNNGARVAGRINTQGTWSIGTTSSSSLVTIASTTINALSIFGTTTLNNGIVMSGLPTNTSGNAVCIVGTTVVTAGNTTCVTSSIRFKKDIEKVTNWRDLLDIDVVEFNYKSEYADNVRDAGGKRLGFIAEQVNEVDPQLVQFDSEGKPLSVHFDGITAKTVLAIQEMQKEIDGMTGKAQKSAQDNWQWFALGLLALVVLRQQYQIKKLSK